MNLPFKVAVSQRIDVLPARRERRDALDQRLITLLLTAGLLPVPVPNCLFSPGGSGVPGNQFDTWIEAERPAGVVLSGGNDVGEHEERDRTEAALLAYAQNHRRPVLGICRGMQMMGMLAGGRLVPVEGHVSMRHRITAIEGHGGWPDEVNSFHNFALADCPPGFHVTARTADGVIEAIRHESLPWEGWMWHPEREDHFLAVDIRRLQAMFR